MALVQILADKCPDTLVSGVEHEPLDRLQVVEHRTTGEEAMQQPTGSRRSKSQNTSNEQEPGARPGREDLSEGFWNLRDQEADSPEPGERQPHQFCRELNGFAVKIEVGLVPVLGHGQLSQAFVDGFRRYRSCHRPSGSPA